MHRAWAACASKELYFSVHRSPVTVIGYIGVHSCFKIPSFLVSLQSFKLKSLHSKKLSHHQYLVPKVYFDINHRNHVSPCSHYAKFCLLCKKICRQETISSENNFFHLPKFSQVSSNFKDAFEKIWRLKMFFVSRQDSCFRWHCYPSLDHLIVISGYSKSFGRLRSEQGCRDEKLVITTFSNFCKRQTLFLVVVFNRQ